MRPLSILIVEDQALLAMELQMLIENAGHVVADWATDTAEVMESVAHASIDLAIVDVHLADGPTGMLIAEKLLAMKIAVVFTTANVKRVPADFIGAIGIIAKPYTAAGMTAALSYLQSGVLMPPPSGLLPAGFQLSPSFQRQWSA
jgi:DNA-binding response OmpR family regulator